MQRWWPYLVALTALLGGLAGFLAILLTHHSTTRSLQPTEASSDPSLIARAAVDALFARQSSTLDEASGRYTLHTGRPPPPYYADWYRFARDKRCLIDEYDRVHRDFKPFYQLAADNPTFFQDMVDRADEALEKNGAEIATMVIQDGKVTMTGWTAYGGYLSDLVGKFSRWLPNMTFFINGKDEPRVAFNFRAPGARENALLVNDSTPFQLSHRPTSEFFAHQSGCNVPLEATGLRTSASNFSGFLIESAKPGYTTDLYPMFSMSKVSPCFSDILYPTQYYYERSWWSGKFSFPDNVPWDEKKSQIYWRGTASGGLIVGDNYHRFPRFRLMHIGRKHPDLMDVRITTFTESYCQEGCDRAAVLAAYNITGVGEPREDMYGFKYALDIDGATFSGRFLGLMRSGSLVFKSTLFEEYFNDWLRPFEHYVPVLPDLSDLVQKVEWANANPGEARLIQQRGLEVARRVLTDEQNDCYMYAAVVEWAQLYDYGRSGST